MYSFDFCIHLMQSRVVFFGFSFKISDETTSLVGGSLEKKRNVGVTYSDVKDK